MKLSSFLYPLRCPICDGAVDVFRPQICPACRQKIPYCTEPRCLICGQTLLSDREMYCSSCSRVQHAFLQGRAAWIYRGAARESLHRYKFANRRIYAPFYAQEMLRCMGGWIMSRGAQALVPVPVSRRTLRRRGYNQSLLIAEHLSRETGIVLREDLLFRREGFRQQKELSRQMRMQNLRHAFYAAQGISAADLPQTVILVDDIYTTGSTIDAAARVLLDAGVQTVYAAYVCVGEM